MIPFLGDSAALSSWVSLESSCTVPDPLVPNQDYTFVLGSIAGRKGGEAVASSESV
jgi:hypothetical protein